MSKLNNPFDAEDICQDTFANAWRALPRYDHKVGSSIRHWLFKIATNQTTDLIRQKARWGELLSCDERLIASQRDRAGADPLDLIQKRSLIARIQENLDRLDPSRRQVVFLKIIEDRSYQEIAELMHKSVGAVRVLLCRGLKELRVGLNGESGPKEKKPWEIRERRRQTQAAITKLAQEKGQFSTDNLPRELASLDRKLLLKYVCELVRSGRLQKVRAQSLGRPAVWTLADFQTLSGRQGPQSAGQHPAHWLDKSP